MLFYYSEKSTCDLIQHILTPKSSHIDSGSGPFGVTFWRTGYTFSLIFSPDQVSIYDELGVRTTH